MMLCYDLPVASCAFNQSLGCGLLLGKVADVEVSDKRQGCETGNEEGEEKEEEDSDQSLFIPHDRMFYEIDGEVHIFVTAAKGIEPRHNVRCTIDSVNIGGLGLHQIYWTYRSQFISLLQCDLRSPRSPLR